MANAVQIGGFSDVGDYANVGLGSTLHQFTTIGAFAMVGMGSIVAKDVPPFVKAFGNPMRVAGLNVIGMQRGGLAEDAIAAVTAWYERQTEPAHPAVAALLEAFHRRQATTHRQALTVT
jgi:UDP-N-acetylglucosamine acyltransferase